ncbi:ChaN family lipoprotein [Halomonas sp. YLGW01]|uniref:ChaN family lipoprotein n=1 Tax=Halomonas sp. YLGW01 TaxID=2773308 RepID=UPI001784906F|nr:ChaN family lipoprotein [Halomonas sp. YLGW01]
MQRRDCLTGLLALSALGVMPAWARGAASAEPALGRVRDLAAGRWLDGAELAARLAACEALIIGERHDNAEHHRLERWLIERLAAADALGGVAMEMLGPTQQQRLNAQSPRALLALEDVALQEALAWSPGWDFAAYGPTLRRVLALGVPLAAANLSEQALGERVMTNRAPELPTAVATAQRRAIVEGHCGLLPEARLPGMLAAQVGRDRAMAAALSGLPGTAVLICGAGHARRDLGVARYLERPEMALSLGLVELPPGVDWHDRLPASVDARPAFDLVWFTKAIERGDPCRALRARFG